MVSEFDFINNIKRKYGLARVGDDCAVLPKDARTDLVVTADMLAEDIDFRLSWTTPEFLGHKALAVSLSDIAAMGAAAEWAMLSIGIPESVWTTDFVDRFYEGWQSLASRFSVELIGGDVSKTPDKIVVDSVVGGTVSRGRAIMRSTACVGDGIFVTGSLGGAAGGLRLLESGERLSDSIRDADKDLILRQLRPMPRLDLAKILQENGYASAMIDISDGFSSDLRHLCDSSGAGAIITDVPVADGLVDKFGAGESLRLALHGGEDFELLFTVSPDNISKVGKLPVYRVGTITQNFGAIEPLRAGRTEILEPEGYRHF